MNDAQLRIGDADRETAARELGEHYALGRITTEEHAERLEQIWAARTQADLAPAFADLPGSSSPRARATSSNPTPWAAPTHGRRPRVPAIPFLLKVLIGVIVIALVLSHLSLLVVALVLYVFGVRRLAHRNHRHPRWR
jgi:Flp pilus assembly protein TadB